MGGMNVELNDDQMTTVLHAAIVQALGEKGKEILLEGAVKYLTTKRDSFGKEKTSPIQDALHVAVQKYAGEYFREMVGKDERLAALVKDLYEQAYQQLLDEKVRARLASVMTETLAKAITGERW